MGCLLSIWNREDWGLFLEKNLESLKMMPLDLEQDTLTSLQQNLYVTLCLTIQDVLRHVLLGKQV